MINIEKLYTIYIQIYTSICIYTSIYHYIQVYVKKRMIRFKLMMLELEKHDLEMI